MSLILNIDTSSETASLCIARSGQSLAFVANAEQRDHAAWMHPAISKMMQQASIELQKLNAVAVTAGPGSYTGLRVGMAAAKGLCYALNIPLITENTLRVVALAARQSFRGAIDQNDILFCPMIDARRMEVFTALFNSTLIEIKKSQASELNELSFTDYLDRYKIFFCGNGSKKFQSLINHHHAIFLQIEYSAIHLMELSSEKFAMKDFSDIVYTEPLYLKEFYTPSKK